MPCKIQGSWNLLVAMSQRIQVVLQTHLYFLLNLVIHSGEALKLAMLCSSAIFLAISLRSWTLGISSSLPLITACTRLCSSSCTFVRPTRFVGVIAPKFADCVRMISRQLYYDTLLFEFEQFGDMVLVLDPLESVVHALNRPCSLLRSSVVGKCSFHISLRNPSSTEVDFIRFTLFRTGQFDWFWRSLLFPFRPIIWISCLVAELLVLCSSNRNSDFGSDYVFLKKHLNMQKFDEIVLPSHDASVDVQFYRQVEFRLQLFAHFHRKYRILNRVDAIR